MIVWQCHIEGKCPSLSNMERDITLFETVRSGQSQGILRIYDWDTPAITVGHHLRWFTAFDRELPIPVIPRPTGGGAVLHGDDITFSLSVKQTGLFSGGITPSYILISRIIASALGKCGLIVRMEGENAGFSRVCFARSSPVELVCAGRKIMGLALLSSAGHLLFQGTMPLRVDRLLSRRVFGAGAVDNLRGILDIMPDFRKDWFIEYLLESLALELDVSLLPDGNENNPRCHDRQE